MSGFDRSFRMNVLSWGTCPGSRLSGCPEPMRRMAPYVIGKALRFSGRRAFSFCHHGGGFRSGGSGRNAKDRRAGVARRSELAVVVRIADSAPKRSRSNGRVILHPSASAAAVMVLPGWIIRQWSGRGRSLCRARKDVEIRALESHRKRAIQPGFDPQLLSFHRHSSTAARNLIALVMKLDRVIVCDSALFYMAQAGGQVMQFR
jgi:hypothetical protein